MTTDWEDEDVPDGTDPKTAPTETWQRQEREAVEPVRHLVLGLGEWMAGTMVLDDMPSLCFGPAPEPGVVGEAPSEEAAWFGARNGAVIISFASLDAAKRMLDLIHDAVSEKQASLTLESGAPQEPKNGE